LNKYHVILADPAWSFADKKKDGRTKMGAENHYPCMKTEDICALPVDKIAEKNCVLFMWSTFPHQFDQRDPTISPVGQVAKAWGFKYRTIAFMWIKTNLDGTTWHGVGSYAKSNPEPCYMYVRGNVGRLMKDPETGVQIITDPKKKLSVISNRVSSVIYDKRRRHSEKPPVVRDKIVELFGNVSRAELFSRQSVEGWDGYGLDLGTRLEDL
jgi:N6-adenosine-specific RNA methylase IME4